MRVVFALLLVGCVHLTPTVIDPDHGESVVEEMAGENDPLAIAETQLDIAVVDRVDGYRQQHTYLRAPYDTTDRAVVRFLIRAQQQGATAVTAIAVHEINREVQCVTRVPANEIPQPEQSGVAGRLMAHDETSLTFHHALELGTHLRYRPFLFLDHETRFHREPSQVVVLLNAPKHPDRTCTLATARDPRGDMWVSGTLLFPVR